MAPKGKKSQQNQGNSSPLVLSLGEGLDVTLDADDVTRVSEFVASLSGGQVKNKLNKFVSRKQLSKQDSIIVAEALATEYTNYIKNDPKIAELQNKKVIMKKSKNIASQCAELLKDDSDDEVEETPEESVEGEESIPDEEEEEAEGEEEEDADAESDAPEEDTDEEIEARAGAAGFIPVSKPWKGNSGKISIKSTLFTATYRTKEGNEHNPTAVVGVAPGTLKMESDLNEDGTVKRKTSSKMQTLNDHTMWFFRGSLSEDNLADTPLKTGYKQSCAKHLQNLCAEITVRAFSQEIFTHKSLKNKADRGVVKKNILKWFTEEMSEGIGEVLEQMYEEARGVITAEKADSSEVKRKLDEKTAKLSQISKKLKKTAAA